MNKAFALRAHRLHNVRVGVAEVGHGDARQAVQVFATLGVEKQRATPVSEAHGQALVGVHKRGHKGFQRVMQTLRSVRLCKALARQG